MKFGEFPIEETLGHILAHSLKIDDFRLGKGTVISREHIARLKDLDQTTLIVAIIEETDLGEDVAAEQIGATFQSPNILVTSPVAGRVNLIADCDGLLVINRDQIDAFNDVDETITIATLAPFARVQKGMLLATIKIIPYGVSKDYLVKAVDCVSDKTVTIAEFKPDQCDIILTETNGFKQSLLKNHQNCTNKVH